MWGHDEDRWCPLHALMFPPSCACVGRAKCCVACRVSDPWNAHSKHVRCWSLEEGAWNFQLPHLAVPNAERVVQEVTSFGRMLRVFGIGRASVCSYIYTLRSKPFPMRVTADPRAGRT